MLFFFFIGKEVSEILKKCVEFIKLIVRRNRMIHQRSILYNVVSGVALCDVVFHRPVGGKVFAGL